jgi:hypothetical protein
MSSGMFAQDVDRLALLRVNEAEPVDGLDHLGLAALLHNFAWTPRLGWPAPFGGRSLNELSNLREPSDGLQALLF